MPRIELWDAAKSRHPTPRSFLGIIDFIQQLPCRPRHSAAENRPNPLVHDERLDQLEDQFPDPPREQDKEYYQFQYAPTCGLNVTHGKFCACATNTAEMTQLVWNFICQQEIHFLAAMSTLHFLFLPPLCVLMLSVAKGKPLNALLNGYPTTL